MNNAGLLPEFRKPSFSVHVYAILPGCHITWHRGKLSDRKRAEIFEAPNSMIVKAGEETVLEYKAIG